MINTGGARTAVRALLGVLEGVVMAWRVLVVGALLAGALWAGERLGMPAGAWVWIAGGIVCGVLVAAVVRIYAPGVWGVLAWPLVVRGWKRRVYDLWRTTDGLPVLRRVRVSPVAVSIDVAPDRGQSRAVIGDKAGVVAAGVRGISHAVRDVTASSGTIRVVMRDVLAQPRTVADIHRDDPLGVVTLGRTQEGGVWRERLLGATFLVVGAASSGKGSILWGVVGSLAPHVRAGTCELWGIDLKGGVEVGLGEGLFTRVAYNVEDAITMLDDLVKEGERRMELMRGKLREMPVGKEGYPPMIMLIIDELATLTAYVLDKNQKSAVEKLLPRALSTMRALGISTMAFVQDPRQNVVLVRGLFTRTISLRTRSAEEAAMATGIPAALAPSHEIPWNDKGVAWVVDADGSVERTRSDYWTDDQIRELVSAYGVAEAETPEPVG